jgi:hypothetical protein
LFSDNNAVCRAFSGTPFFYLGSCAPANSLATFVATVC